MNQIIGNGNGAAKMTSQFIGII